MDTYNMQNPGMYMRVPMNYEDSVEKFWTPKPGTISEADSYIMQNPEMHTRVPVNYEHSVEKFWTPRPDTISEADTYIMQNPGMHTRVPMNYEDSVEKFWTPKPDTISEAEFGLLTPRQVIPQTPELTSLFCPTYEWMEPNSNRIPSVTDESQLNQETDIASKLSSFSVEPMPVDPDGVKDQQYLQAVNPIYTTFNGCQNQNSNQSPIPALPIYSFEPLGKQPIDTPIYFDLSSGQIYATCDGYSTIDIETLEVQEIPTLDLVPSNPDLGQLTLQGLGRMGILQDNTDPTNQIPTLEVQPIFTSDLPGLGIQHENTHSQDDDAGFEAPDLTPPQKKDEAYLEFRRKNTQNTRNFRAKARTMHNQQKEKVKILEKEHHSLQSELQKELAENLELKAIFTKYKLPLPKF